jgi:hypothetical protein
MAVETDERLVVLEMALTELDAISIPVLEGSGPWNDIPDRERLSWAIRFYVGAELGHCRELLRAFLLLARAGLVPASVVVARALFELAGTVTFVSEKLSGCVEANDTVAAGDVMLRATMGNRYMSDRREKNPDGLDWVAPVNVLHGIDALDKKFPGDGSRSYRRRYDRLSEVSHPNMGALFQHYRLEEDNITWRVRFDSPLHKTDTPPLGDTVKRWSAPLEAVESALLILVHESFVLSLLAADQPRADAFDAALTRLMTRLERKTSEKSR